MIFFKEYPIKYGNMQYLLAPVLLPVEDLLYLLIFISVINVLKLFLLILYSLNHFRQIEEKYYFLILICLIIFYPWSYDFDFYEDPPRHFSDLLHQ